MKEKSKIWLTLYAPALVITLVFSAVYALLIGTATSTSQLSTVDSIFLPALVLAIIALGVTSGLSITKSTKIDSQAGTKYSSTAKFFIVAGTILLGILPGLAAIISLLIYSAATNCSLQPKCM
ncbi:MAG: hypothetical protein U0R17_01070 [Acidimicrobiia bacterium]